MVNIFPIIATLSTKKAQYWQNLNIHPARKEKATMFCIKCKQTIPDGSAFCLHCGANQQSAPKSSKPRSRPNGTGSAYKRGKTWTACWIAGWKPAPDGRLLANKRTKGGFPTKKEALEYVSTLKTQGSRNPDANITFASLFERFEAQHDERVKDTTMAGYKSAYKHFNDISAMRFASIGVDDLQYCIDAVPGKRTRQVMKALASLLYKYAGSRQIVDTNLAQYIYVGKGEQIERPAFTMAQLNTVRNAVGSVPYTDYILCMCYLGFRPNEMLSLTKKAYHEEDGASYLVGGFKTEAGTNRKVTISPKILPIIRRRLADKSSIYLFPKQDGSAMRDAYFRDIFYETLNRLGIQPIPKAGERAHLVPYSCRHTFANLMKNVTGSDTDKAALMGHADASMTKKYQSEELENLVRITNAL
jgi:integrase